MDINFINQSTKWEWDGTCDSDATDWLLCVYCEKILGDRIPGTCRSVDTRYIEKHLKKHHNEEYQKWKKQKTK